MVKPYFQNDMAYRDFKNSASDKALRNKPFNFAKNLKNNGYQCEVTSVVYEVSDKTAAGSGIKREIMLNQESAEDLHNLNITKSLKNIQHTKK